MAKAADKSSTRLLLKDARERVTKEFHASRYAEKLLVKWIAGERLPWGYRAWDGYCWRGMSAEDMIRTFWSKPFQVGVNWEESYVYLTITLGGARFILLGVWVSGEALEKLLAVTAEPEPKTAAASVTATVVNRRTVEPREWLKAAKKTHPQRESETKAVYAARLAAEMEKDLTVKSVWRVPTVERRLRDKAKDDAPDMSDHSPRRR